MRLRFYDDAGLLLPEQVDPLTGYRFYAESQLARAAQLRQLRAIGMPLPVIGTFFAAAPDEAAPADRRSGRKGDHGGHRIQLVAAALKASLDQEYRLAIGALPGSALAAAVDQVLATTIHDPDIPC